LTARLNLVVEGQTEEAFVNQVLAPHLGALGIAAMARCVETSRRRAKIYRGGLPRYDKLKGDLTRWMRQDRHPEAWFTTMIDLYGLDRLQDEFPGFADNRLVSDPYQRIVEVEQAFAVDIDHPRFIPYLQLHEFEALILADPKKLDWEFIDNEGPIDRLVKLAAGFDSPELIDDGFETSPCRRIVREIPEYGARKPSAGPLVTSKIGLPTLRQRCPHFAAWLQRLEELGSTPAP
jgi:hypothetical protein